jgi:hypothetical protein
MNAASGGVGMRSRTENDLDLRLAFFCAIINLKVHGPGLLKGQFQRQSLRFVGSESLHAERSYAENRTWRKADQSLSVHLSNNFLCDAFWSAHMKGIAFMIDSFFVMKVW